MSCTGFHEGDTPIHRLDPRPRIIVTLLFSVLMAVSFDPLILCLGIAAGVLLASLARVPARALAGRILRINIFMAVLFLLVPVTWPGRELFSVAGVSYSAEGVFWSLAITLKGNAIVLVFTSLAGTIDPFVLGHAFHHLKVPAKLAHLFMFTLRYADIFHHEHLTLIRAMKARGFRPSMRLHTYKTYADMTGMLLVRSLERSERIMDAMKCRGFTGSFHVVSHFRFERCDLVFTLVSAAVLSTLVLLGWS